MKKFIKALALILSVILFTQIMPAGVFLAADNIPAGQVAAYKSAAEGVAIGGPEGQSYLTAKQAAAAGTSEATVKDSPNREPTPIVGEVVELRTENTKYFRHRDGTYVAAMYAEPVHYKDATGKFKDIDNTLQLNSKKLSKANKATYTPAASGLDIRIPQDFANGQQITVGKEGYTVGMGVKAQNSGVADLSAIKATVKNDLKDDSKNSSDTTKGNTIEADNAKKMELKKQSSSVTYRDVFPGADLEYIVTSGKIKESISVKEAQKEYTYQFNLSLGGLIPVPQEDGSIFLFKDVKDKEPLFKLEAPYMYDAAGAESTALKMVLTDDGLLTLTADEKWINDETRKFPVVIDPTLVIAASGFEDAYISTALKGINYSSGSVNYIGKGLLGTRRTYLRFTLPELPEDSVVSDASLTVTQTNYDYQNGSYQYLYAFDCSGKANWFANSVTWNNQPLSGSLNGPHNDGTNKIDYSIININNTASYVFNLTKVVKNWYDIYDYNNGLMLATDDESDYGQIRIGSIRNGTVSNQPAVKIYYNLNTGLEDYWSYDTINMGRSGTVNVNDYNGALTYTHTDLAMSGNRLPINISHILNNNNTINNNVYTTYYSGMYVGSKIHLNLQELLLPITSTSEPSLYNAGYRYRFYDSDGTLHYFKLDTVTGKITHEFDTSLVVTTSGSNRIITDGQGNKKYFNSAGQLFKLEDNNGNTQTFTFSGNRITQVTDGADDPNTANNEARVATLSYNAYNQLTSITDPAGRSTTFAYASTSYIATLSSITYPDGKTTSFTYANANYLTGITAYDNSLTTFSYHLTDGCGYRIGNNYQYDKARALVNTLKFQYTKEVGLGEATGNTVVTNLKPDNTSKTKTYLFDAYGRATSITNQDGQTQYADYGSNTNSTEACNRFNKIVDNSELQTIANNLVKNHGFEQTNNWSALQTTTDGSYGYNTAEKSNGFRSMKMDLTSNTGAFEVDQDFTAAAGQTYTVSVDIKIPKDLTLTGNNGVKFGFVYCVNGTWQTDSNDWIASTTGNEWLDPDLDRGWQRFTHTITLPSGTLSNCHVFIELARTVGSAYFDNIQVEKSGGARYYNLMENSDFSFATGTVPYGWTLAYAQTGDGVVAEGGHNSVRMTGARGNIKQVYQYVPVHADAGDVLIIGGRAAANAAIDPAGTTPGNSRLFGILAEICNDGINVASIRIDFDSTINMEHQTKATSYTLTTPCDHIDYYFCYYDQVNTVYFDNAFIYMGNYGEHYGYNDNGQLNTVINDDNKKSTNYTYNANNDLAVVSQTISGTESNIASFAYNNHNVTTLTNNNGTAAFGYNDENGNSQHGQVTSQTITEDTSGNNPLTTTEQMTYIQGGNYLKTFTDANGGVTTYTYDNNDQALKGLVMQVEDPEGNETHYTYDPDTDELLSTSGNANPSTPSVTSFTSQDYLPKTVTRNTTTYSYDYDNQNRVTATKVGNQTLVSNTYDSRQRLAQQSYANQAVYTPVYDSRDRLIGDSWNNVQISKYFYNENDRLSQFTDNTTGITYKYDYAFYGLMNRISGSDGSKTAYDYDASGQLSHLTFMKNGDTIYKARYASNEKGNPEDVVLTTLGDAMLHYNYDGLNRLTGNSCGPLITERTYPVDTNSATNNLVETYTNKTNDVVRQRYEYVYDLNGNITGITDTVANQTTTYTYDGLNRLTRESGPNGVYVYNYDVGGNLTTITNSDGTIVYKSYAYGNSNWKDQLTSINTNGTNYAITYDANGNPLTYNGCTFTWQRGSQLTGYSGNGQNISYTYDAKGHRTSQTVNGTTINYTYSGDLLMRQTNGTNTLDFQYDASGIAAGFNYNGSHYYYLRNLQGDVTAIADANGTLVANYTYDAWGNVTAYSGAMASINPIRYRGYYQDPVTGWYFLQSRYYNPDWRRFLNADSMFIAGGDAINGSNMYAYCNGNPVMNADPSGMGIIKWIGSVLESAAQAVSKWTSSNYNKLHNKASQWVSKKIGEEIMTPGADWFMEKAAPKVGGLMDSIYSNSLWDIPWQDREYPFKDISILQLRPYFQRDMSNLAGLGAMILDFHENVDWNSPNAGNYTTLPGNYQWQKGVGYAWWYDWFFNLGGPIDKRTFPFEANGTHYIIWCWKGDYWNLGAGAEIGIYYALSEERANEGYYEIDPDNLKLRVLMNIIYNGSPITTNWEETYWWVTSFTPKIQSARMDLLQVHLKVEFDPENSSDLMKPFYDEGEHQKSNGNWPEPDLIWAPTERKLSHLLFGYCDQHPTHCTCALFPPCCYYSDDDYEFYINY